MSATTTSIDDYLCAPDSHTAITRNEEGNAYVSDDGHAFGIQDDIPSFTDLAHFDGHWDDHANPEIPASKLDEAARFLGPAKEMLDEKGVRFLDAGCGDGVHVGALNQIQPAMAVGLDISGSALRSAKQRDSKNHWHFVHGDVVHLPFRNDAFDLSFSYGVLAYTDNPAQGFAEMVRVTRSGGLVGVWLYPKRTGLSGALFSTIRGWCRLTGRPGTLLMANMIVPFLRFLPTTSGLTLSNASWKECREVVMVNIAPKDLWFPTHAEIEAWFKKHGMEIISTDPKQPITIWGRKP